MSYRKSFGDQALTRQLCVSLAPSGCDVTIDWNASNYPAKLSEAAVQAVLRVHIYIYIYIYDMLSDIFNLQLIVEITLF